MAYLFWFALRWRDYNKERQRCMLLHLCLLPLQYFGKATDDCAIAIDNCAIAHESNRLLRDIIVQTEDNVGVFEHR